MDLQPRATDQPITASLKATYRALLARGLEAGEAANLTAFLHGLPSAGFRWTLPEIEAIIQRRLMHAADQRVAAGTSAPAATPARTRRSPAHARRQSGSRTTHVMDQPTP
jgi:hypothetical protein